MTHAVYTPHSSVHRAFIKALRVLEVGEAASRQHLPAKLRKLYTPELALGRGAFGCVLKAKSNQGGECVAIKLVSPEKDVFLDKEMRQLQREAATMELFTALKCDHAVQLAGVQSVHIDPEICWFVMELLQGDNMETIVRDQSLGPISDTECIRAARHVLAALKVMHAEGIVHRDIKPANIVRCEGGPANARKRSSATLTGVPKMDSQANAILGFLSTKKQGISRKNLSSDPSKDYEKLQGFQAGRDARMDANRSQGTFDTNQGIALGLKEYVYKLIDFGTALGIDETLAAEAMMTLTSSRAMGAGTPPYMSPEMFKVV